LASVAVDGAPEDVSEVFDEEDELEFDSDAVSLEPEPDPDSDEGLFELFL
jgi:hypothetical protein